MARIDDLVEMLQKARCVEYLYRVDCELLNDNIDDNYVRDTIVEAIDLAKEIKDRDIAPF